MTNTSSNSNVAKITIGVIAGIFIVVALFFSGRMFESVEAGEIVVIQHPISGELEVYSSPGVYSQYFGTSTHYRKRSQFWFSKHKDQGSDVDRSIKIRFNDGGHAQVSGSVSLILPTDKQSVIEFHTKYGSQESIENQLVRTDIEKSIYMTGPLMSSKESYAEKRNDLISYIDDQASKGVYKTTQKEAKEIDPITGTDKTVTRVEILRDVKGAYLRQEQSPLEQYHISLSNLSINSIDYDPIVEKQIAAQQQATMQVQTAMANAKRAEQDAITVEQQGKAEAAKAKWEQEVLKAKAVTQAQQQLEVQTLDTKKAELYKKQQILEGEGEAAKKRLQMQANGALEQKLEALVKINAEYAKAMSNSNWVPTTVIGGGSGNYSSGAMDLINMMTVKTARELNVDLTTPNTGGKTGKK